MFLGLFIFRGHSTREPASGRVTFFYSAGLHRNHVLATANTGKIGRGFGKNSGEWTGRVEISKEKSLAVSVTCMAINWPTPGFKERTFKLCVLIRWDFDFCVRSSPLWGQGTKVKWTELPVGSCLRLLQISQFFKSKRRGDLKQKTRNKNTQSRFF